MRKAAKAPAEQTYACLDAALLREHFRITPLQSQILAILIHGKQEGFLPKWPDICGETGLTLEAAKAEVKMLAKKTRIIGTVKTLSGDIPCLLDRCDFAVKTLKASELPPDVLASFASAD